jgi:hypothetical protein
MREYSFVLFLIVAPILTAVAAQATSVAHFFSVRFHGIQYSGDSSTYDGRYPTANDIGPEFGRATCDTTYMEFRATRNQAPSQESSAAIKRCLEQEGGASGVPPHTPFYTLRGYRPDYRLAAQISERWIIFYATENPRAKVGADLLDLDKKVARITFTLESSARARTQWSSKNIQDTAQIEKMTRMILTAPIAKQSVITAGASRYRYRITLWFKDGTAQGLAYFPDSGWLNPGVQMPQEFRRLVEEQLPPN